MRTLTVSRAFIIVLVMGVHTASAQIPKIKIPKVKPQPTPETQSTPETQKSADVSSSGTPSTQPTEKSSGSKAPGSGGPYVVQPEGPASPQFLIDTLQVDLAKPLRISRYHRLYAAWCFNFHLACTKERPDSSALN